MDKRAKITIFVGIGVFVFGILGMVIGAVGVGGLEESTQFTLEEVTNGTIYIEDEDNVGDIGVTFWVKGTYVDEDKNGVWDLCETVEITVTEHPEVVEVWAVGAKTMNGSFYSEVIFDYDRQGTSSCDSDLGNRNFDRSDKGYVKIGRACFGCTSGDFSFESNASVSVTYDDKMGKEVGEDIVLMFIGFLGGGGALCCGVVITFIGIILIFTLKEDAPVEMVVGADGTYTMSSAPESAVGIGVSQNIAQVTTSTVITEEMTQNEPFEFPSTQSTDSEEATDADPE